MVRRLFAAADAFLIFLLAVLLCFLVAICLSIGKLLLRCISAGMGSILETRWMSVMFLQKRKTGTNTRKLRLHLCRRPRHSWGPRREV